MPETAAPRGLVHVSDADPGITRRRAGRGFTYFNPDGARLTCEVERARVRSLGVPPAYSDVWICARPDGHIQATGKDARLRKQYLYHPDWSAWRDTVKFGGLVEFGMALARVRAAVARDLMRPAGDLEFAVAAVVTLLDRAHLRVGTSAHTRANRTYGATTLLRRHLSLAVGTVRLRFATKGGKRVQATLRDARLHRVFQEIDDLPGRRLFAWIGPDGEPRPVESHHVNAYIADRSGMDGATAKTFRTWGGTLAAFTAAEAAQTRITKRALAEAASGVLHNTPTIARKSYIHPDVLALAQDDSALQGGLALAGPARLRAPERRLLGFLSR